MSTCQEKNHIVQGYCLNLTCPNLSDFCYICQTQKHQTHLDECKSVIEIEKLLKYHSNLNINWQNKLKNEFEKVQSLFYLINEFLKNEENIIKKLENHLNNKQFQAFQSQCGRFKLCNNIWKKPTLSFREDLLSILQDFNEIRKQINQYDLLNEQILKNNQKKKEPQAIQELIVQNPEESLDWEKQEIQSDDEAFDFDPNSIAAIFKKGNSLFKVGNLEKAIKCYDIVINRDQNYVPALFKIGVSLYKLRYYKESIRFLDRVINLDAQYPLTFYRKGMCLKSIYQQQQALLCFDEAIRIDPQNCKSYYKKSQLLCELQHYKEALFFYDQAINLDPKYIVGFLTTDSPLEDFSQAIEQIKGNDLAFRFCNFKYIASLRRKSLKPQFYLAFMLEKLGKKEEALQFSGRVKILEKLDANY